MGQAKLKQRAGFAPHLVEEWESRDCIDFAFALARLTGWLLHVDWWVKSQQGPPEGKEDGFQPVRAYVADNKDLIFDPRGVMSIFDYRDRILRRQVREREFAGVGGVLTRYYGETSFSSLPLRYQPDEEKIKQAIIEIHKQPRYLASIPARNFPNLPAHQAAQFSFSSCSVFAEALHDRSGLQPTAMLAIRFMPGFEGTDVNERGYFHSVALHPDGMGEDSWGKAPLSDIAMRYGVAEFVTSNAEHSAVVRLIKQNTPDTYATRYNEAISLIQQYANR